MERFNNSQRVRVVDPQPINESLRGKTGTVYRLLMRSREAWVRMDEDPKHLAAFFESDSRRNDVCLWPFECEPELAQESVPPAGSSKTRRNKKI